MPSTEEVNTAAQNFIDESAEILEDADAKINGASALVTDRHGVQTKNLELILSEVGYEAPFSYTSGVDVSSSRQTTVYDDEIYAARGSETPFTTGSSFDSTQWLLISASPEVRTVGSAGQSNMNGRSNMTGGDMTLPKRCNVWDGNESLGSSYAAMTVGAHPLDETPDSGVTYSNNILRSFCLEAEKREGCTTYVTQHAKGSHPIENFLPDSVVTANSWSKTTGSGFVDFGSFMYTDCQTALLAVPGSPTSFDDFLINLGESNATDSFDDLRSKMFEMLKAGYDEGIFDYNTIISWSELPNGTAHSEDRIKFLLVLLSLQIDYPNLRIVNTAGLPLADSKHLTGESVDQIGRRYYSASKEQPYMYPMPCIDESFTPILQDGSGASLSFSNPSGAVAQIKFERMFDDNLRMIGIGGDVGLEVEMSQIVPSGSGDLSISIENLTLGNTGTYNIVSRSGSGGQSVGAIFAKNITYTGQICVFNPGANSDSINLVTHGSGVGAGVVQVSDLDSSGNTSGFVAYIRFPIEVV